MFANATSLGAAPRAMKRDMMDNLVYDSRALQDLTTAAKNRLADISVVSFYETKPIPGLPFVIVDSASATLDLPNEEQIPMFEDHRSICRFSGETQSYKKLESALRRLAVQATGGSETVLEQSSTHSSTILLSDFERTCMAVLSTHHTAKRFDYPASPAPGTCLWIRTNRDFLSWEENRKNGLLWLTGHPGSGKSTLSWSLSKFYESGCVRSRNVITYMCQNRHQQTDGRAILVGFILQLVDRHRSLLRYVRPIFERQGPSMVESFQLLWRIFLQIMGDPKVGSLYIILDALDECERASGIQLLQSVIGFLVDSDQSVATMPRVKFLVTSRPSLQESYIIARNDFLCRISIDDNPAGYAEDIQLFIRERIEEIALHRHYSNDIKDFLHGAMASKADQNFLWIQIVLESIERSLLTSIKTFQQILAGIPDGLAATYSQYLASVPSGHHEEALKLLELLLASQRPLSLHELNVAFTIDKSHAALQDVMRDAQTAIAHTVHGILGPMIRITNHNETPTVRIVHQSLKDFLLEPGASSGFSFADVIRTDAEMSALRSARACIQYLFLRDFEADIFTPDNSKRGMPEQSLRLSPIAGSGFWDDDNQFLDSDILFREPDVLFADIYCSLRVSYQFLDYASLHWMVHFAACEKQASDDLQKMAAELLDNTTARCRNWLQYYHTQNTVQMDDRLIDRHPVVLAAHFNLLHVMYELIRVHEPTLDILNLSLFWACRLGHERIVEALLRVGAEPESAHSEGQNALAAAAEHGHLQCVVHLLEDQRANVNAAGRRGRTALSFSCAGGYDSISRLVLHQDGCDADTPDVSGATPLFWAVGGGYTSIIVTLVRNHAVNVNHQDRQGRTALSWAAGDGVTDGLNALMALPEADVNLKDNKGLSPLLWAARNGHAEAVGAILGAKSVDKSSLDNDKRGAISWTCGGGHHGTLVKLLQGGCSGKDAEDIDGWTPLAWAVQSDAPEVIQALSEAGAPIDHRDSRGRTALLWAVEYGHLRVVEALIKAGANPYSESNDGDTTISIAERFLRTDIMRILTNPTGN